LQDIARQIDGAVVATLEAGVRTPDLGGTATTESLTDAVIAEFRR
jgi:3-isopropylmalate dehydrogenase